MSSTTFPADWPMFAPAVQAAWTAFQEERDFPVDREHVRSGHHDQFPPHWFKRDWHPPHSNGRGQAGQPFVGGEWSGIRPDPPSTTTGD